MTDSTTISVNKHSLLRQIMSKTLCKILKIQIMLIVLKFHSQRNYFLDANKFYKISYLVLKLTFFTVLF